MYPAFVLLLTVPCSVYPGLDPGHSCTVYHYWAMCINLHLHLPVYKVRDIIIGVNGLIVRY